MRKVLYLMLAFVAIAATACRNGEYPANIQGTWVYADSINYVTSVLSTSSSSSSKGIPATIDYVSPEQTLSTKVLINYDPEDGRGTFAPEKGTQGLQGSFEAIDKLSIELTLINVDNKDESTTLLRKVVYNYKKDTNNN